MINDQLTTEYEQDIASSQIDAIVSLLDDPDPIVQSSIRSRLLELGGRAATALRTAAREGGDVIARANAGQLLKEIGVHRLGSEIRAVLEDAGTDDIDLERGAFAVARLGYPEFRFQEYRSQIDTMAAVLEGRLRSYENGYLVVREINYYLFDQLGFQGCPQDRESYFDPENSYLNRVLERRVGIPISLSVIYILIARRLRVPIYGVGFPRRFLITYRSAGEEFFIDPFNGGTVLNYSDCRRLLRDMNIDFRPEYLEPVSHRKTVARMIRNLVDIYRESNPAISTSLEGMVEALVKDEG